MNIMRLWCDDAGDSHIDATELDLTPQNFAPPAEPFLVSALADAAGYVVIELPVGWGGDNPHPTPARHMLFCLSGQLTVTASDGAACVLDPGEGLLMTDTSGRGHSSLVTSNEPVRAVMIRLES